MFQADGQPHKAFGDAGSGFHIGRYPGMGHAGGVFGEAFRRSEAHGQLEDLKGVEEGKGQNELPMGDHE